jgi:TonB family protein
VGKLKLKLPHDVMRVRWFLLAISFTFLAALPSLAQKLPPDLQQQVNKGFLTRQEAELLNSARGQTSPGHTSGKGSPKPSRPLCREGEDVDADHDADFSPYMASLKRRVRRNWNPPDAGSTLRVLLHFKVSRSGDISKMRVTCSSGNFMFDQAAIDAVQHAAPFGSLPSAYKGDFVEVIFTFDANVFGGGVTTDN